MKLEPLASFIRQRAFGSGGAGGRRRGTEPGRPPPPSAVQGARRTPPPCGSSPRMAFGIREAKKADDSTDESRGMRENFDKPEKNIVTLRRSVTFVRFR